MWAYYKASQTVLTPKCQIILALLPITAGESIFFASWVSWATQRRMLGCVYRFKYIIFPVLSLVYLVGHVVSSLAPDAEDDLPVPLQYLLLAWEWLEIEAVETLYTWRREALEHLRLFVVKYLPLDFLMSIEYHVTSGTCWVCLFTFILSYPADEPFTF